MAQYYDWDAGWTVLVNGQAISSGGDHTSGAVELDQKAAAEVSIEADYAAGSPTEGLRVYLLRELDGTNYETEADEPWGFMLPHSGGVERRRTISVDAAQIGRFKLLCTNDSGVGITVTVRYRTAVIASG